jgi:hypothetical protein
MRERNRVEKEIERWRKGGERRRREETGCLPVVEFLDKKERRCHVLHLCNSSVATPFPPRSPPTLPFLLLLCRLPPCFLQVERWCWVKKSGGEKKQVKWHLPFLLHLPPEPSFLTLYSLTLPPLHTLWIYTGGIPPFFLSQIQLLVVGSKLSHLTNKAGPFRAHLLLCPLSLYHRKVRTVHCRRRGSCCCSVSDGSG